MWHMTNLRNYMELSTIQEKKTCWESDESVSIPRGIILTDKGTFDYTKYTAFINTNTCEYYFKTYDNSQIATTRLISNYNNCKRPIFLGNLKRPVTFEKL